MSPRCTQPFFCARGARKKTRFAEWHVPAGMGSQRWSTKGAEAASTLGKIRACHPAWHAIVQGIPAWHSSACRNASPRILRAGGFQSVPSANEFRFADSRANALRMGFQEVAGTAHCGVGIAYRATRTGLLGRLLRSGGSLACVGVASIAAVVAGTTGEQGQEC